ncbi:cell surface protein SprA [Balneola vulgaris]|uniref:T9SS outer membrane translocon Sov/SprA n=1 Tax=Balneola vulgaris TaxID=287535 RepID=UPI0003762030|nr:cell surface protein SprA [Balneola vulgaris]
MLFSTVEVYAQEKSVIDTTKVVPDSLLQGIKFYPPRSLNNPYYNRSRFPKLYQIKNANDRVLVNWDSTSTYYLQPQVDGVSISSPWVLSFDEYASYQKELQQKELRYQLIEEGKKQETQSRGLLDFKMKIPGGEKSAFTTIFGKPEVNLRVNGSANMNVGASIQNVEDTNIPKDLRKRVDPTFNQNLQLNIQGTIGDKLTIATDWDTERQFDFQNRLKIEYEGYEDEILKNVQLGNVSMETGNSLIKGGGSLFGIKSVAELGPVRLTSVISQQKGESQTQTITGGSQEVQFKLQPTDYEDDQHFFLDFYNRQEFQSNMLDNLPNIGTAYTVNELNVWIEDANASTDPDAIAAYAFVDMGVVENMDGTFDLPDSEADRLDDDKLEARRNNTSVQTDDLDLKGSVQPSTYYKKLIPGEDYEFNSALGIISLKRRVGNNSSLAVSYSYIDPRDPTGSTVIKVGDVTEPVSGFSYLKLLRPRNNTPNKFAWELTLRNVYSLGVTNVTQEGLDFNLEITRDNQSTDRIPGRDKQLLQDLGLDLLNSERAVGSDSRIDFDGIRFDSYSGKIMFPYLEPFGARIDTLIQTVPSDESELVFDSLYSAKKEIAFESTQNRYYEISGSSKGGVSRTFYLGELVEGTVKVFANGAELIEGTDYEVDYSFGNVTILNDKYLAQGQNLRVDYESNQFFSIGQKNFTGLRAEYDLSRDIKIGGTFFKLSEQPLNDKIRIGNEPINNTVFGLDANARFDTPWLTRAIDKVPLLQTREESNFSISGEFAQIRPGVAQTNSVRDAIDNNRLFSDEENGLVFIDDFEGAEFSIPFKYATRWYLPSAPAAVPGYAPDDSYFTNPSATEPPRDISSKIDRADLRAQFVWYEIPRNIKSILRNVERTPESRLVKIKDVFQGRETNNPQEEIINTLDVYYDPTTRGPYNYNTDLKNITENEPERMWGGMTALLPTGQEDLAQNNIEFIEFWVQPLLPDGREPSAQDAADYDGKIYIDLGIISEDIVPNEVVNTEDGLAKDLESLRKDDVGRSYIPAIQTPPQGEFSNDDRDLEDVGLDGVPSQNGFDPDKNEQQLFRDFLEAMKASYGLESAEYKAFLKDPSNDDYVDYQESVNDDLKLHERFHRVRGYYEGNTPVSGNENKKAITLKPDREGLITASNVEIENSYYQYEIAFNPGDPGALDVGSPGTYIVDKVDGGAPERTWHLVRIPLEEFKRKIGDIAGFQNISYVRFWVSGYKKPMTMRFATFEFIGSQWREEQGISESQGSSADFKVATVNIEENASRTPIPYRQPEGAIRAVNRGSQLQSLANEQSLVLSAEGLGSQELKMVKRVYPGGLNFLNYSNIRMFVHGEGYDNREDAELVIRMGTDLENDYYEYRQPVSPTDPNYNFGSFDPDDGGRLNEEAAEIWKYDENSMNIIISAFNILKQERNAEGSPTSEVYERNDLLGEGTAPGAILAIKGNPSLDRVSEFGIGIRNPNDIQDPNSPGTSNLDAEFWVNELRVSGFDNENGWAANAKANIKLADFASMNANLTRQTIGFGGLDSRLGQRSVSDNLGYAVSSTVNLHKLIPDRFGWSFPVTVSARRNSSTPKFLPDQGDIRLDDFISAVESRDNLGEGQKKKIIDERIDEVQTVTEGYSLNISNVSKRNSKSKLAQYTLDKLKLNYVYNEGYSRNPQLQAQNNWNFSSSLSYNLNFTRVQLFRPFGFTENIPGLNLLSGLRLGYMPSSITASTSVARTYDERRRQLLGDDTVLPIQQTHSFTQKSNFGLTYNLTPSIQTSFRSNTNFDLSNAGIESANKDGVDSLSFRVKPTFEVFEGILTDTLTARRSSYSESFTARWQPKLDQIKFLDWINYSANYGGGFQWTNSPSGSELGATISNTFDLTNSIKFNTTKLFDGIGFINKLEQKDKEETQQRRRTSTSEEESTGGIFEDINFVGRKLVLALFSMRSVDLNYKKSKSSSQTGYDGESQFYYAFSDPGSGHYSPPLGYRLGLFEDINTSQLIRNIDGNTDIQLPLNNNYSDNITLGTSLRLFNSITIDLDWATQWDERNTETITLGSDNNINSVLISSGNVSSSVWAFGSGYEKLFKKQLGTAFEDLDNGVIDDNTGNNDGRTVLNRVTLQEDFRNAYLGGNSSAVGGKNFTPIPKPNWRVTWQGVEKLLPIIGDIMSRASITHSYQGNYRLGWQLINQAGDATSQSLGGLVTINDVRDTYEPSVISIDQRFSPLLQLNVTWKSALKTNFGFESSKLTSLSLSSKTISERRSKGYKFNLNYTFRRVNIPFFPNVKNNIDLAVNGSFSDDSDRNYLLGNHLISAFSEFDDKGTDVDRYEVPNDADIRGQKRYNGSLIIGYRISSTINSNFEYTFNRVIPKSSGIPARTNQEIRFNIRIAIQSR